MQGDRTTVLWLGSRDSRALCLAVRRPQNGPRQGGGFDGGQGRNQVRTCLPLRAAAAACQAR